MKPRRFSKKIVFTKKTIVNLNDVTMKGVWAGGQTAYTEAPFFTCGGSSSPEECCANEPIT